jgi:hypothetical protein
MRPAAPDGALRRWVRGCGAASGIQGLTPPGYVLPPLTGLADDGIMGVHASGIQGLTPPGYVLPPLTGLADDRFERVESRCVVQGLTPPGYVLSPLSGLWGDGYEVTGPRRGSRG